MSSMTNINILADVVIVVILLSALVSGKKKGFIRSVAGLAVSIASLFGAKILTGIVTEPITNFVFPYVEENVLSKLELNAIDVNGMDIVNKAIESVVGSANDMMNVTARAFVESIVHALAFVVCFILLKIFLKFLVGTLDKIADLPLLKSVNGLLGAAFGLAEACLFIFLVPYIAKNLGINWFEKMAEGTRVLDFFVHSSPFDLIQLLTK